MRQVAAHKRRHDAVDAALFDLPAPAPIYQVRVWLSKKATRPALFSNRNRDVIENLYRSALRARMRAELVREVHTPTAP